MIVHAFSLRELFAQDRLNKVHQLSAKEIAKLNLAVENPASNG